MPTSSKKPRRIKVGMYLDADQVQALKAISVKTRIPQSVLVREAIEKLINKYRR